MNSLLRLALFPCLLTMPLWAQDKREYLLRMAFPTSSVQFHRKTLVYEMRGEDATVRTNTLEVTLETKVTAVAEGKASLEQTVRRVVTRGTGPGAQDYDSDAGGKDPAGVGLMVGQTYRMKVDEQGRTSDFKVPDDFPRNAASDPWFIQALQFAEAPTGIGKTWEARSTMVIPEASRADVVLVHKLTAVDKGRATIETLVKLDKDKLQMPAGMTIEKNGGTTVIELATGRLLESRSELVSSVSKGDGKKAVMIMTTSVQPIEPAPAKQAGTQAGGKG